jgi:hypothetical protein
LLAAGGYPVTQNNKVKLTMWAIREGGHFKNSAKYNPLNITKRAKDKSGQCVSTFGVGICAYDSYVHGIEQTLYSLKAHPSLAKQLKDDADYASLGAALKASNWDAGHYAGANWDSLAAQARKIVEKG